MTLNIIFLISFILVVAWKIFQATRERNLAEIQAITHQLPPKKNGGGMVSGLKELLDEKILTKDKLWRSVVVIALWGLFNLSLWSIFPEKWWVWHDTGQFFWGTQGTILAILILEVVFKSKENAPVITRMRQALIGIVLLGFVNIGYEPAHKFLNDLWKPAECTEGIDCKDDLAALDKKNKSGKKVVDTIIAPVGKLSRGFVINHETRSMPGGKVEAVVFRNGRFVRRFIDSPDITTGVRPGDTIYFQSLTGKSEKVSILKL